MSDLVSFNCTSSKEQCWIAVQSKSQAFSSNDLHISGRQNQQHMLCKLHTVKGHFSAPFFVLPKVKSLRTSHETELLSNVHFYFLDINLLFLKDLVSLS
jgi:hypothetical protein